MVMPLLPGSLADRARSLLADPGELQAIAARIGLHAAQARTRSVGLAAAVGALDWRGLAAEAFRGQAEITTTGLRLAADRLDDAADSLRRHAARVDGVRATILAAGGEVERSVTAAAGHLLRGVADVWGLASRGAGP
jgi:uncharacterized protein YukE